jgi:hypothetical protein
MMSVKLKEKETGQKSSNFTEPDVVASNVLKKGEEFEFEVSGSKYTS